MDILSQVLCSIVIVISGLVLIAKAMRGVANLLDRFADRLRTWADEKAKKPES